jgi:hypothetical protein
MHHVSLIINKAYTPALLLTRKMLVSVGAMREETSSSEPCFRETKNVTVYDVSLEGFPCTDLVYLVVKRLDIGE